jgi:outer membrane receptor protein involved in Fe transport
MKTQFDSRNKPVLAAAVQVAIGAAALAWLPQVSAQELMLEEVIVTAQKRTESLQDVPIAVTAISGEKIIEAGIKGMEDLTTYVPNVQMFSSPGGGSPGRLFIRGIGTGNLASFEQSVGTFVDGVYTGKFRQYLVPFLDVGSVEVLKGPQGTLFGKNTVAGAMIINSARPTDTLEGEVRAQYEFEYGSQEFVGIVSGPMTDNLSGRLAAKYQDFEGYMDNLARDTEEPEVENTAVRGSLLWDPTDTVAIYAKLEYAEQETVGNNTQLTSIEGNFRGLIDHRDVLTPLENGKFDDKNTLRSWNEEGTETDSLNAAFQLDWDLGDLTLTSLTGYSEYESDFVLDGDTSNLLFIEQNVVEEFDQISQEFRLSSPGGETLEYIAGIYLEAQDLDNDTPSDISLTALSAVNVPGSPVPPVDLTAGNIFELDTETAAVFGQLTWHFADDWALTGGLRYSYEEKEATITNFSAEFGEREQTDNPLINTIFTNLLNRGAGTLEDDRDTDFVSWSANLAWDYSVDGMAYLRVARGFKSGGFNDRLTDPADPTEFEFDDEEANTVELGAKMSLLDGAANLNMAAFYTEIDDSQESSFVDSAFIVQNSDIESKGVEIEGRWIAAPFLNFSASVGYLDSEYADFPGAPCTTVQLLSPDPVAAGCVGWTSGNPAAGRTNLKGTVAGRSPEWTATFITNVVYPVGESMFLRGSVDVLYEDELNEKTDPNYQDSYTRINARLALASASDTWSVALIGKNLTDETTFGNGFGVGFFSGSWAKNRTAPRTVALELGYRFQ